MKDSHIKNNINNMKQFLLCILLTVVSAVFGYLLRMSAEELISAHDHNKGVVPVVLDKGVPQETTND